MLVSIASMHVADSPADPAIGANTGILKSGHFFRVLGILSASVQWSLCGLIFRSVLQQSILLWATVVDNSDVMQAT